MNARQVEAVASDLARSRRRIREAQLFAAACTAVALATVAFSVAIAVAFGAGAATGALLAMLGSLSRQGQIARLALDPLAYELPEWRFGRIEERWSSSLDTYGSAAE